MKIFFQALSAALALFLYGYFLSVAGHDHSAHEGKEQSQGHISHEHQAENAHEHNHDHSHE